MLSFLSTQSVKQLNIENVEDIAEKLETPCATSGIASGNPTLDDNTPVDIPVSSDVCHCNEDGKCPTSSSTPCCDKTLTNGDINEEIEGTTYEMVEKDNIVFDDIHIFVITIDGKPFCYAHSSITAINLMTTLVEQVLNDLKDETKDNKYIVYESYTEKECYAAFITQRNDGYILKGTPVIKQSFNILPVSYARKDKKKVKVPIKLLKVE